MRSSVYYGKGEPPIANNGTISVLNARRQPIGVTYPKRAKGLVKKGRARYLGEMTIMLDEDAATARPPVDLKESEDKMDNISLSPDKIIDNDGNVVTEEPVTATEPQASALDSILKRIDTIVGENAYILKAIESVNDIDTSDGNHQSVGLKASAIENIVRHREDTNKKMLELLERMYDDMRPQNAAEQNKELYKVLRDSLVHLEGDMQKAVLERLMSKIV
ncbi:MAG: hypothetical protein LBS19_17050 [Clostridiales bacterium]|jgi:hypothetical protein|nr:hypothetical protein [Clostridiales bacterium]